MEVYSSGQDFSHYWEIEDQFIFIGLSRRDRNYSVIMHMAHLDTFESILQGKEIEEEDAAIEESMSDF